jgi:2-polyprenyl-6-hydroxyphenyl methylase/3-demethylubiquinone-9 3-methyltransferase
VSEAARFEFGKNWQSFLAGLSEQRIVEAERSLVDMVGPLSGKRFLDIGSGSGLFSLAARRLGARVVSFDYDPQSVACTAQLKDRYFPGDDKWVVTEGSVLDADFVKSLGSFDVVYSWGVLHHTGSMWQAMKNAQLAVADQGVLFIAIYNDQGLVSTWWKGVKRLYGSGRMGRTLVTAVMIPFFAAGGVAAGLIRQGRPLSYFREYVRKRGMSPYHDWVDWLGGYPFEVARPDRVLQFHADAGFALTKLTQTRRHGCNQYVFRKT